jgi:hypothetical protein
MEILKELQDAGLKQGLKLLKPKLPQLADNFLPMVTEQFASILKESDNDLTGEERESAIMIFKDSTTDDIFFTITKLSADEKVLRASTPVKLETFLGELIKQAIELIK